MVRIVEGETPLVLINTFRVKPEKADALVDLLQQATDTVMRHQAGFISASLHRGPRGDRIVNYAQWRSLEDYEAMQANPEARKHMKACARLAEDFDPQIYAVASVHEALEPDRLRERRGDEFPASLRNLT
ncbi:MAG: antibiotic biosynthesis monooxygenase [Caulobacteraceae bacterium]|nr:antibiotic biosynthesis monooxygenase [Caulobacteraceae bacterium]